ncbi:MAG: glycosyltransferase [Cytophagales bacterium]|nr:glycosyltransferase [Cytophagales bacterium]
MIIAGIIALVHITLMCWLRLTWNRIPRFNPAGMANVKISVIIPVRNEESNIAQLLEDLKNQDYRQDHFEVIVVNDHSTDDTVQVVEQAISEIDQQFRLIHLADAKGKKAAATFGVQAASGDFILCTDGDCRVPRTWISTYAAFIKAKSPYMVSGPVKMTGSRFFDTIQAMDFSSLQAFGATSLEQGMASSCNGANMAYSKEAFIAVDGYKGNENLASGDDEFLLQKIFAQFPDKVFFMKSPAAIVETSPKNSLKGFIQQRVRWASKWRFYQDFWMRVSWVFTYVDFMSVFFITIAMLFGYLAWLPGCLIIAARWMAEMWYLRGPVSFLKIRGNILHLLTVSFIYPFYVLFLGFASIFGAYSWKGRRYG